MKTSMHVDYHYIPQTEIVALPDVSVNKPFCLHEGMMLFSISLILILLTLITDQGALHILQS